MKPGAVLNNRKEELSHIDENPGNRNLDTNSDSDSDSDSEGDSGSKRNKGDFGKITAIVAATVKILVDTLPTLKDLYLRIGWTLLYCLLTIALAYESQIFDYLHKLRQSQSHRRFSDTIRIFLIISFAVSYIFCTYATEIIGSR